jgi:hypothetical protein
MTDLPLAHRAMAPALHRPQAAPAAEREPLLSFGALIDAVNPLQHLPVVSTVYRAASGDAIGVPARLAGGFLFGGPLGLLASAASVVFEAVTGGDVIDHVTAALDRLSEEEPEKGTVALPWLAAAPEGTAKEPAAAQEPAAVQVVEAALGRQSGNEAMPGADPVTVARLYALEATRGERA